MKTKNLFTVSVFVLFAILLFSSCAEVQNIESCRSGEPYGFLGGLWHGVIAPVSFVLGLFMDDVAVWAVNNNGGWYEFGFLIGVGSLGLGGGKASRK
ncbi:MAG: hypothetical protein H7X84_01730 [Verrucomicrobia bacterium]|nr:hypothetical protein [Prolixibacteraceae bacterium]